MPADSEGEIAAIFRRLKEEVRTGPAPKDGNGTASANLPPLPSRSRAERAWAVTAERPFENPPTRGGRVRGLLFAPIKRVLRKLMRWYVEPVAAHQRTFNAASLALVDELAERTQGELARLERRLDALEERLERERRRPSG